MDVPEPSKFPELSDSLKMFICAMFAMLGGVVREIKSSQEMTWIRFMGGAFIGMFCGIVVFCLMRHFGCDDWFTAALTSLAGYMGTPVLDLLGKVFKTAITKGK